MTRRDLRIDLVVPVMRFGFGPLALDPVRQFIGMPLSEVLESLLVGPVTQRPSVAGPAVEVYPLALPEGEGASIPLGQWGELGFANTEGNLVLTAPLVARKMLEARLAGALVEEPRVGLSTDGRSRVVEMTVRLRPGMRMGVPLGMLGELGVEAA